jgi:hypothetical protein
MPYDFAYIIVSGIHGGIYKIRLDNTVTKIIKRANIGDIFSIKGLGLYQVTGFEIKATRVADASFRYHYIKTDCIHYTGG